MAEFRVGIWGLVPVGKVCYKNGLAVKNLFLISENGLSFVA
jgi:hypothetical protein